MVKGYKVKYMKLVVFTSVYVQMNVFTKSDSYLTNLYQYGHSYKLVIMARACFFGGIPYFEDVFLQK